MNKLFGLFLLALAFLAPNLAQAANCFWVGGTGSINDTTKWSSSSGGSGSTCAAAGGWPNSTSDSATFDGSSGAGTITRNVNWTVSILNPQAFTGTLGNAGDTATVQFDTFQNSAAATRTINMGASTWTCGRAGVTACSWFNFGAGLTLNTNTSNLVVSGSTTSSVSLLQLGGFAHNAITLNPDQANAKGTHIQNSATITTLSVGSPNTVVFLNNQTITTLSFTGGTPAINSLVAFLSDSSGTSRTLTLTNPASCSYCVFRDITAATSAITATKSMSIGNNTNINITPPTIGGGGGRIIGG